MGNYTGIRFKGYVKPEFRNNFDLIAKQGKWESSDDAVLREFGKLSRAAFIPCGPLDSMPSEWEQRTRSRTSNIIPFKGEMDFERQWDKKSGYWVFQCSLKNYQGEIEYWFDILPHFIEKVIYLEQYNEEWLYSERYDLIDNKIQLVDGEFKKY